MGISGFFGRRNLLYVSVVVEFPDEIYAGRPFPLKITVKNNKGIMPGFLLRVTFESNEVLFPYVGTKTDTFKHLNISFPSRGKYSIETLHVCSVFPFNLFIRCIKLKDVYEYLVLPEPKKCHLPEHLQRQMTSKGEKPSQKAGYDGELISVRQYRPTDPIKYISWKATAKTGQFKTKELSSLAFEPVIIDFDNTNISDFEERISCITYTVLYLIKRSIPVGLKINDKVFKPETSHKHKLNMLRELALLTRVATHKNI